jgi:hypothetical protein
MRPNPLVALLGLILAGTFLPMSGRAAANAQDLVSPTAQIHAETPAVQGAGRVGQRQTRWDAARIGAPMTRIASRLQNRVDNRVHTRIDRGYQGLKHLESSFEKATEQTRVGDKTLTR